MAAALSVSLLFAISGAEYSEALPTRGKAAAASASGDLDVSGVYNKTALGRWKESQVKWAQKDYKSVISLMRANLAMSEVGNDDYMAGSCHSYLAGAYEAIGDMQKALENHAAAAARFQRVNLKEFRSDSLSNIGRVRELQGKFREAVVSLRLAVELDREGEEDQKLLKDSKNLARMLEKTGDISGAVAIWQELLRDTEVKGETFEQGECCFGLAGIYERQGKKAAAAELRDKGQKLQQDIALKYLKHNGDPAVDKLYLEASRRAEANDTAGAYSLYEKMLAESERRGFRNGMVMALRMLASAEAQSGRWKDALLKMRRAVDLAHADKDEFNEGGAMLELGVMYVNRRDFTTGLSLLEQARVLNARIGSTKNEMATLHHMRQAYSALGDFHKILDTNAGIAAIAGRSNSKRDLVIAENDIARFYGEIGDMRSSLEHYAVALDLAEQLGNSSIMADQLNEYGIALMNSGDHAGAVSAFRRSLAMREWGGGYVNLAEALLFKGELEKAAALLQVVSDTHIDLGYYYLRRGDYAQAKALYHRNFPAADAAGRDGYLGFTKPVDQAFAGRTGLGLAYEGLGEYYKASYHYKGAQKLLEMQRDSLSLEHRLRFMSVTDWMMPHLEPYEGMVRISEFLPGGLRDSLFYAEYTRGRLFTEYAARSYSATDKELPPELSAREEALNKDIAAASAGAEAARRSTDNGAWRSAEAELTALKTNQARLAEELRLVRPLYAAVRYPTPLHVEEFALQPGEALLEFEVTEPYTKAFLVKDGRVALSYEVRLTRNELSALVKQYRAYFEKISDSSQLAAFDPGLGKRLYDLLLKPALEAQADSKPLLAPDERIIIAPDEILSILPFESLVVSLPARLQSPSGKFGPAPVGVKYVADERDITYTYSGSALTVQRRLKPQTSPSKELLVLADPVFNPADSRLRGYSPDQTEPAGARIRTMGPIVSMGIGGRRSGKAADRRVGNDNFLFQRLDKTGLLATELRDKIFREQHVEVLTGTAAAKADLLGRDLAAYRYLVMATHGVPGNTLPGLTEPALVLTQFGSNAGDNGLLTMSEVMRLRLNADVVALTACQTGLGDQLAGEGVLGLGRAFQYAGARNVLVSLWSVSEASTTMLAERFFFHLRKGVSMRQALRLARSDVRRAGYEHPFYWAPFILIGE